MCRQIIAGLSVMVKDLVIVSGLAYGIDVCAHRAALKEGLLTVAVLGHGMSTLYPWSHRDVARQIRMQGALVSDFHSQMGPERNNFLRRNRIIAGLADATLVVESAESGGALITAHMAVSYHRDVLAIPGRAIDLRSSGCNRLIRLNLAALVESPKDIIHHLNWEESEGMETPVNQSPQQKKIDPSGEEKKILCSIKNEPGIDQDSIVRQTGLPIQLVLSLLMEMELKDWISMEPGNRYSPRVNFKT
jgi:DNA processing protein